MGYTILLVDDSETIRLAIARAIGMTDLVVDEILQAGNGKEALAVLANKWVDIVFSDINMPEMNGIEFVTELRASGEYAKLPVVIISTEGSKSRMDDLQSRGVNGYLRKPFTPEQLRDTVLGILGSWHGKN